MSDKTFLSSNRYIDKSDNLYFQESIFEHGTLANDVNTVASLKRCCVFLISIKRKRKHNGDRSTVRLQRDTLLLDLRGGIRDFKTGFEERVTGRIRSVLTYQRYSELPTINRAIFCPKIEDQQRNHDKIHEFPDHLISTYVIQLVIFDD